MGEIVCYDTRKKRRINRLYQWDRNFSITVEGVPTSPLPLFQFANRFRGITIDLIPEVKGDTLIATVPDELLEMAEPISLYFYRTDASNNKRTIGNVHFPIIPRMKPGDDSIKGVLAHYVTFMSDDGSVEYGRVLVIHGNDAADPISSGLFGIPTKDYTVDWDGQLVERCDYEFDGWSLSPNGEVVPDILNSVETDLVLYAHFSVTRSLCALPYPDLNYNGIIDEEDANIILRAAALVAFDKPSGLNEEDEIKADIDCDGLITAKDAHVVLDFVRHAGNGKYENNPKGWNLYMRDKFVGEKFYNVEYYVNNELVVTMVNILRNGTAIYPLEQPSKDGYKFVGWSPAPVNLHSNLLTRATFHRGES